VFYTARSNLHVIYTEHALISTCFTQSTL